MMGAVDFIIQDAQEQARTPVIGYYYVRAIKRRTKPKGRRKCSRRQYQRQNRRQWVRRPIYAEPTNVLEVDGKFVVTPLQKQALIEEIERRNRAAPMRDPSMPRWL